MKIYVLKEADFDALLTLIDRDPRYGYQGGSSRVYSEVELEALRTAHDFFNYQIRAWIQEAKK